MVLRHTGANPLTLEQLISTYGYVVVGVFIAIEGMGVPLPGELVLLSASALAARGHLTIGGVMVAAWAGTIVGGAGGYWVGLRGGLAVIRRFGHWFGISEARLAYARAFFERHGVKTVIIARFVAILRMVAGVLAGVAQMPFGVFSLCNAIGGLLWTITFATLGYIFGQNLPLLEHYVRGGSVGVLAGILAVLVVAWIWRRRRRNSVTLL